MKAEIIEQFRDGEFALFVAYSLLIDKIYPNLLWENPYVFIYEFKLIK